MSALSRIERTAVVVITALTALAGVADYGTWAAVPRFLLATLAQLLGCEGDHPGQAGQGERG